MTFAYFLVSYQEKPPPNLFLKEKGFFHLYITPIFLEIYKEFSKYRY